MRARGARVSVKQYVCRVGVCARELECAHAHKSERAKSRELQRERETPRTSISAAMGSERQRKRGEGGERGKETWKKATQPSGSGTAPPDCRSKASRHLSYGAGQWSLTIWSLTGMRVNISLAGFSNVTLHLAPPSAISDHVARRDLNVSLSCRIGIIQ